MCLKYKNNTAQKMKFPIKVSSVIVTKSVDLGTFTKEILNGQRHFLCNVGSISFNQWKKRIQEIYFNFKESIFY